MKDLLAPISAPLTTEQCLDTATAWERAVVDASGQRRLNMETTCRAIAAAWFDRALIAERNGGVITPRLSITAGRSIS